MVNKILSVVLCVIIFLSVLIISPFYVNAATSGMTGECVWELDDNGTLTISGNDKMLNYYKANYPYCNAPWYQSRELIKNVIINDGIQNIGDYAFFNCVNLISVSIPDSVTSIGNNSFYGCEKMLEIVIPDNVVDIDYSAFMNCTSLEKALIGDSVTSVGDSAFDNCTNLTSLTFGNDITNIGGSAFSDCSNLKSISIPDKVKNIGSCAFADCYNLNSIRLPDSIETVGDNAFKNTGYYNDSNNWDNNVLYIGNYLIYSKKIISGNYLVKQGTIAIAWYAFSSCDNLTGITIPDSVLNINGYAFFECTNLKNVSIGENVQTIGACAFNNCSSLSIVIIPDSVTDIVYEAFFGCTNLASITLPKHTLYIGSDVFSNTKYYNDKNNWNDNTLYMENHLINVDTSTSGDFIINDDTLDIACGAFYCCEKISNIKIPNSVVNIGDVAFYGCKGIKNISIPKRVNIIYASVFMNCTALQTIELHDNISSIGEGAFLNCFSLSSITITNKTKKVYDKAFYKCNNLKDVYYSGSEEEWNQMIIGEDNDPLLNANIHFINDNDTSFSVLNETFEHNLQYYAENLNSTEYNPELAHLMMTFADAAYTPENIEAAYNQLGLTNYDSKYYDEYFADHGTEKAPFNVGYVTDDNSDTCVLVSIRGSGDIKDISQGTLEWIGNASMTKKLHDDGKVYHENFLNTMLNIHSELDSYLYDHFNHHIDEMDNVKYFITGHSRGAAVANLLESEIAKSIGKQNVYGYNFAVPDSIYAGINEDLEKGNENIFNVSNIQDPVSYIPGYVEYLAKKSSAIPITESNSNNRWWKKGVSVWFSDETDTVDYEYIKNAKLDGYKHNGFLYIDYLRKRKPLENYLKLNGVHEFNNSNIYAICCPVDVELIDENGNVIASVKDNIAEYSGSNYGEEIVSVLDNAKLFLVPKNKNYTLHMIGNDSGTMNYYIQDLKDNNEGASTLKAFEGVSITNGKEMSTSIIGNNNVGNTQLFALNSEKEVEKEILTNGTEVNPIVMNKNDVELVMGDTIILSAESADDYYWYSTDESVVTVESGTITAKSNGNANIIVETVNGARAICSVSVCKEATSPETETDPTGTSEAVETVETESAECTETTEPATENPTETITNIPTESTESTTEISTQPMTDATEPTTKAAETTIPVTDPTETVTIKPTEHASTEPTEPATTEPTEPATTEPTQAITTEPTEPVTIEPTQPVTAKPTEPVVTKPQPTTPAPTTPVVKPSSKLKPNPIKVTIKKKTVKLKKLKKKAQKVKPITIKKAQGKVSIKITSVKKVIKKHLKFNSKGTLTIKRWKKAKKGTYKIKVKITVKGNSKYKPKTIKKTVKIKIK